MSFDKKIWNCYTMNCLLIDDNTNTREEFSSLLKAANTFADVHYAVQPYMVRSLMAWAEIDIVFIRVRLWNYLVFEKIIEEKMPVIVFLSGGKEKITEKSSYTVTYSLGEPYSAESLRRTMTQIVFKPINDRPHYFFIRYEGEYHKINFSEIELVESMKGNYVKLHTSQEAFLIPGWIAGMMDKLPADRFVRISDGLIVPVSEVPMVKEDEYVYKGKIFKLTFRFSATARREMYNWPEGL